MIGLIKKVGEKNYLSNSRFCTIDSAVEMSVVVVGIVVRRFFCFVWLL